ncbi:hypothetical protein C7B76_31570, partial [filamentous cyanobacterium CCP2]
TQPPSPSVPISVYRELAAELQATRAMVDSLNAKNQDLTGQNQRLRQEIQRFVQSAMHLQVLVDPTQPPIGASAPNSPNSQATKPRRTRSNVSSETDYSSLPTLEETAAASAVAAQLRSNEASPEAEADERPTSRPSRDFSGLWLSLIVMLIMVTAFGAGFLVVRPLLPTSNGDSNSEETIDGQSSSPSNSPTLPAPAASEPVSPSPTANP